MRFPFFDRSSVWVFTNEGFHCPRSARLPWSDFVAVNIKKTDDDKIAIGDKVVDLAGTEATDYHIILQELQSQLRKSGFNDRTKPLSVESSF